MFTWHQAGMASSGIKKQGTKIVSDEIFIILNTEQVSGGNGFEIVSTNKMNSLEHILDNPIYHALDSGNKHFSNDNGHTKCFPEEVSPLTGLKENSPDDFNDLYRMSSGDRLFVLFSPEKIDVPLQWKTSQQLEIQQMVYDKAEAPEGANPEFVVLEEQHVPDMLLLTKMTNPGPFLSGTIRLGNYRGIFSGTRLVAMAGQRLQPKPYVEISAVCTHPDYLGKGYASLLITDQINRIIGTHGIPFLHVRRDNAQAIRLYQKLGFIMRKEMTAYVIRKSG